MIFKCKNCGGNTLYSPVKKTMCCPNCDGLDSEEKIASPQMDQCVNCGAPIEIKEHTSATKCPNCGNYIILEERVEGQYRPDNIIPFKISKDEAEDLLRKEFAGRVFTPSGFLSSASLDKMEGTYVPFFLYDYDSDIKYHAVGTTVRTWTSGGYEYTETSYYNVERQIEADFSQVPVDAAADMEDSLMDLLEPFDYKQIINYEDKYMSGFMGEKYNFTADELADRAVKKVKRDSDEILNGTLSGYNSLTNVNKQIIANRKGHKYAMLPVWEYTFGYMGTDYKFQVNGQTGKVLGKTPVSKGKVVAFGLTWFGLISLAGSMIGLALSVM